MEELQWTGNSGFWVAKTTTVDYYIAEYTSYEMGPLLVLSSLHGVLQMGLTSFEEAKKVCQRNYDYIQEECPSLMASPDEPKKPLSWVYDVRRQIAISIWTAEWAESALKEAEARSLEEGNPKGPRSVAASEITDALKAYPYPILCETKEY